MTEYSALWSHPSGAGDGAAAMNRTNWGDAAKITAACNGYEGVAPAFLNALAGTVTGANTVAINTGGAMVDGRPYQNDASLNVNIPSAVGGGFTRIDRIVLRASWAAQTVRVTVISGTDAASPSAPAITQTAGTTYDIMLYQALVDTGGTVTLTDERVVARELRNRQGGSATAWATTGGINYILPPTMRMQFGMRQISGAGTFTVTFPVAFSDTPVLFFCPMRQSVFPTDDLSITASGFVISFTAATVISFLAIGPT